MKLSLRKISVKLMAFNILLLSLPMASLLYLDTYERQLLIAHENSMIQQARIMSAALSGTDIELTAENIIENLNRRVDSRIRVVDTDGRLLADSSMSPEPEIQPPQSVSLLDKISSYSSSEPVTAAQDRLLYRFTVYPINVIRKLIFPPSPDLGSGEYYSGKTVLDGAEIKAALSGRYGAATRLSSGGQRSINLYSAIPIYRSSSQLEVTGAVLVSRSTYQILSYLYELRLDIIRIFLIFLLISATLSFALAMNITIPVVRLKNEAGEILDKSGNFRNHFTGFRRGDEIGELSRSLTRLSSDLENKMEFIGKFTSDILHELKNPMATIRGASELALQNPEECTDLLKSILEEEQRMERLLIELREISSLENLFENEKKELISPSELIPLILSRYPHRDFPGVGTVFTDLSCGDSRIYINIDRFVQALVNPVDNAISFSPEDGTVKISLIEKRPDIRIIIEDEGAGINTDSPSRLFERFYSDRPESSARQHSGLGLSIVKSITAYYGGSCSLENSAGGAVFTLVLPIA